jgi:hypothetical protein
MNLSYHVVGKQGEQVLVNALGDLPAEAQPYVIATPATPSALFAGVAPDDTHFLRFPDSATAITIAEAVGVVLPNYDE